MKSRRYPLRYRHHCLRLTGEIIGIEDHEIGRVGSRIDDVAHQPTVIFGSVGVAGHEDKFAGNPSGAKVVYLARAAFEIVFIKL